MAVIVARQGEGAPVRIEAPRPIRPFLRFSKLPPRALVAARVALDDDDFRVRVASRSDEEEVGRAGWLLLTRPDGWEEDLDALVQERASTTVDRAESSARRDLAKATVTIREQQSRLDEQARELHRLRQQLDAQHRAVGDLRVALDEAGAAAVTAADERARAVRELKDMEHRLSARTEELRRAREVDPAGVEAAPDEAARDEVTQEEAARAEAVASMLAEVRREWASLGATVDRLAAVVDRNDSVNTATTADSPTPASGPGRGRRAGHRHRRPVRLGQGLVDGTPEAARWLLARPGVVVLVDGYNVTMLAWPELSAGDQRVALERAAAQLQLQHGAQIVLVFDGDADGGTAVRAAVGSTVRVRFTHRDTEADDEILELLGATSAPVVVVVSNDRRVIDGARERGANVVRSTDFVALLR